ncbi:MAG: hypothetical protein VX764_03910 [Planctomycetota bacterium]|nr:hypothetical protein [Planctomycetota bacterium]
MTVLIGRRDEQGKTQAGDAAFSDGVEHIVFTYDYKIGTDGKLESLVVPRSAQKLLK